MGMEKANRQSGRGRIRKKKTVSDMSGMLGSPAQAPSPLSFPPPGLNGSGGTLVKEYPGTCPPSPLVDEMEASSESLHAKIQKALQDNMDEEKKTHALASIFSLPVLNRENPCADNIGMSNILARKN